MSDFMAKMYQIQFRLGIRPRPRWGSLERSPRPHIWIKGPTSKGRGGTGRGGDGKGEGKGKGGDATSSRPAPLIHISGYAPGHETRNAIAAAVEPEADKLASLSAAIQ